MQTDVQTIMFRLTKILHLLRNRAVYLSRTLPDHHQIQCESHLQFNIKNIVQNRILIPVENKYDLNNLGSRDSPKLIPWKNVLVFKLLLGFVLLLRDNMTTHLKVFKMLLGYIKRIES